MITINFLADYLDTIPTLTKWFRDQWPDYYADMSQEEPTEFQPELGGLYVDASQRGQGIGTELIRAGMKLAHDQGYATVYATTVAAAGILERLGWVFVKTVIHEDGALSLYRCKL